MGSLHERSISLDVDDIYFNSQFCNWILCVHEAEKKPKTKKNQSGKPEG
jgi:hypothetical protein